MIKKHDKFVKYLLIIFTTSLYVLNSIGQRSLNMELISNLGFDESASDIWAYIDSSGREYALVGTQTGTRIIDINTQGPATEIIKIEGANSIWRDIKTWKNYAYVVAQRGSDGLLIIDLTDFPVSTKHAFWTPDIAHGNALNRLANCHNLYIDAFGYAYLSGCNIGKGGVIVLDLNTDPMQPETVSIVDLQYAHDVFVQNNRMYTSELNIGQVGIYDVKDKSNIKLLASQKTGFEFTHNVWVSEDNHYMFTTDERGEAYVEAYDIRNLDQINRIARFKPPGIAGKQVIPHNTHYYNGYLYTSWYTEGLIVTDVHHPSIMVKVGQYDSWDGPDGGFNGNWGVYPFLPSGKILISDISNGLYVLNPDLKRASYVTGKVIDAETNKTIPNVSVDLQVTEYNSDVSNVNGEFNLGTLFAGSAIIKFSHPGYHRIEREIELIPGEMINLNVDMLKKKTLQIRGNIFASNSFEPLANSQILFQNEENEYLFQTDEQGHFREAIYEGIYDVYIGQWEYHTKYINQFQISENTEFNYGLDPGIYDDFLFDYNWTVSNTSPTGIWERGVPIPTIFEQSFANPNEDVSDDYGKYCYITGNGGGSAGTDDVDDGTVSLFSPIFDLSRYKNPVLEYSSWFYNSGGDTPVNDSMVVMLSNSKETLILDIFKDTQSVGAFWANNLHSIRGKIELTNTMQFIVSTADVDPFHVVEGGIDKFIIRDSIQTPVVEENEIEIKVWPNPFSSGIYLDQSKNSDARFSEVFMYDLNGRLVFSQKDIVGNVVFLHLNNDLPGGNIHVAAFIG